MSGVIHGGVITTLVGEEVEGDMKWQGTLAAPNGSLYGMPHNARGVIKFNPIDKSMTEIGPDFGEDELKCDKCVMTDSGVIYSFPFGFGLFDEHRFILKIDTNTDDVIGDVIFPYPPEFPPEHEEENEDIHDMWVSCAIAPDGCIYFMPAGARRIMKLDPNNDDIMTSVGDDLGEGGCKYIGTIIGIDGCVYGIPSESQRIVKYDPINDITSFVGEEADEDFACNGKGALGSDGCIYAIVTHLNKDIGKYPRDRDYQVLRIDTANNSHCFVGKRIPSVNGSGGWYGDGNTDYGWCDPILGIDGCTYWPPANSASRTLKYDPHIHQTSLVGDVFLDMEGYDNFCGALATDGVIYCIPGDAEQVLAIDPFGEFLETTKTHMEDHPEKFGRLFQTVVVEEADANSGLPGHRVSPTYTHFSHAVDKFGENKVFEVMEKSMKPINDFCMKANDYLCPFMIAASCEMSTVGAIYHLLHRDLSWVNVFISSLECNASKNKKRRIK